jgi:hypothetical protein
MKRFCLVFAVMICGCRAGEGELKPVKDIVKIGERDGVKIYRFYDMGCSHWFVSGPCGHTEMIREPNKDDTHHVEQD